MKVEWVEVEVSHKIWVGGYESVAPTVRIRAILEDDDDVSSARLQLYHLAEREWVKQALAELRLTRKRRGDSEDNERLDRQVTGVKGLLK